MQCLLQVRCLFTLSFHENWVLNCFSVTWYGEGKRRNEFAEWHVVWLAEWHNYVECNICRMTQRNKLNWKVRPFWRQSICKRSRCFNIDIRWRSKSHEGSLSISLFRTATKILLAFISRAAWQHRYYSTKVGHNWRKDVLEGHAPFYFNFFCKNVCTINYTVYFYVYLYLQPSARCFFFKRWLTWSWLNIQGWNDSCTCILFL